MFYDLETAQKFDREVVAPALPDVQNRTDIFGRQLLMDEQDHIIGEEPRYLINATSISIDELPRLLACYGGIAIPAHIDKQSKSLLSVFGYVDMTMGYRIFELSQNASSDFVCRHPQIAESLFLYDTDSHYLENVGEARGKNFLELKDAKKETIWNFLLNQYKN